MKKEHKIDIVIAGVALLAITGVTSGCGEANSTGSISPIASASAALMPTGVSSATSATKPAAGTTKVKARQRKTAAPVAPAPATSKAAAPPPPATAPAAAPSTPVGCYPLTNGGNCYEPGEYCRNSDHGLSGVAGDGERIVCENNDGWRWEPA